MSATRPATSSSRQKSWIGSVLSAFPWVHLAIGLLGNTLFVIGSTGMLLGSLGELLVRIDKRRRGEG